MAKPHRRQLRGEERRFAFAPLVRAIPGIQSSSSARQLLFVNSVELVIAVIAVSSCFRDVCQMVHIHPHTCLIFLLNISSDGPWCGYSCLHLGDFEG